jgi:hypothetical protein
MGIKTSPRKKRVLNSTGISIPKRWGSIMVFRYTKNTTQLTAAAKTSKNKYLKTCKGLFIFHAKVKLSSIKYSRLHERFQVKNIAPKVI